MMQLMMLKFENQFINLGRALVQSVGMGHFNYRVSKVCLHELMAMVKTHMVTPLMLKKNPEIISWIAKLCRFMDEKRSSRGQANISEDSQRIRAESKMLLNSMKALMDFDGSNDAFMEFFYENVKLFHELTTNISNIEKRQLTIDPELNLMTDIDDA